MQQSGFSFNEHIVSRVNRHCVSGYQTRQMKKNKNIFEKVTYVLSFINIATAKQFIIFLPVIIYMIHVWGPYLVNIYNIHIASMQHNHISTWRRTALSRCHHCCSQDRWHLFLWARAIAFASRFVQCMDYNRLLKIVELILTLILITWLTGPVDIVICSMCSILYQCQHWKWMLPQWLFQVPFLSPESDMTTVWPKAIIHNVRPLPIYV